MTETLLAFAGMVRWKNSLEYGVSSIEYRGEQTPHQTLEILTQLTGGGSHKVVDLTSVCA